MNRVLIYQESQSEKLTYIFLKLCLCIIFLSLALYSENSTYLSLSEPQSLSSLFSKIIFFSFLVCFLFSAQQPRKYIYIKSHGNSNVHLIYTNFKYLFQVSSCKMSSCQISFNMSQDIMNESRWFILTSKIKLNILKILKSLLIIC